MSWRWPHNLQSIGDIVVHCYPGLVEYGIGDAAHQAGTSDHNVDSRGYVHAIDLMFQNDTNFHAGAPATLAWLLLPNVRNSLEYVIHDRGIWSRGSGWTRRNYIGDDPHTNHIHVSGMHENPGAGEDKETGTGYSTAAEKDTPAGSPCAPVIEPSAPVEDELSAAEVKTITDSITSLKLTMFHNPQFDPVAGKYTDSLSAVTDQLKANDVQLIQAVTALTNAVTSLAAAVAAKN